LGTGEVHTGFWWGDLRERDHLEDLSIDGRVIVKYIFKKRDGGHDLAQDRGNWRALVNAIMNLWFHKIREMCWLAEELLVSPPCS
jgi:hypothetical protein